MYLLKYINSGVSETKINWILFILTMYEYYIALDAGPSGHVV